MSRLRTYHKGDKIGEYTLKEKLGEGGMGEVWLAEYGLVRSRRALKIPFENTLKKEEVLKEAQLWNTATPHDYIVPILEAKDEGGMILIATEYHPDGSLKDWLDKHGGKAPTQLAAVQMVLGILEGLKHLHTLPQAIVHRDIKPANILLKKDTPRLADFGLARLLEETWSGTARGTFHYMAPEAFGGHRTVHTDLWSVGVILYKLLLGRLPFPQTNQAELMNAILKDAPDPIPPSIPHSLQQVIIRALEKEPTSRYSSAHEMQVALSEAAKEIKSSIDYLKSGYEYFKEHNYDAAIKSFDKAIELDSNCAEAYYKRGEAYYEFGSANGSNDGHIVKAVEDLTQAITLQPDYAEAFFIRAKAYKRLNQIDLAIADFDQAIALRPTDYIFYFTRGETHATKGANEYAIRDYSKAIDLKPDEPAPYYGRGRVYKLLGKSARRSAIGDLTKAIELSKNGTFIWPGDGQKVVVDKYLRLLKDEELISTGQKVYESSVPKSLLGCIGLIILAIGILLGSLYVSGNVKRVEEAAKASEGKAQKLEGDVKVSEGKAQKLEGDVKVLQNNLIEADEVTQAVLDKKDIWWISKIVNRTDRDVTCTIYSANVVGDRVLKPAQEIVIWRKNIPPTVKFALRPDAGSQTKQYNVRSKGLLKGPPDESIQNRAVVNYFTLLPSGDLELYYDETTLGK